MGYDLPNAVPGWKVEVFALALMNPYVAARVGWRPSSSHPAKTFKTRQKAEQYARWVEGQARWSLIPIKWRGDVTETTREPDWLDRFRAVLNIRPIWEASR